MELKIIDTHAHLDDKRFDNIIDDTINKSINIGINAIVNPSVNFSNFEKIASLSEKFSIIYPAFGVHPLYAHTFNKEVLKKIEEFSTYCEKTVAIGEIGLDFKLEHPNRTIQIKTFISQLELAKSLQLPVLIHCRRAVFKVYNLLKKYYMSPNGGIMHAYSGSYEMAEKFINMGFLISVAGSVTYPNAKRPLINTKKIPLDNLVVETDSPDILPFEYKNTEDFNKPYLIISTLKKISEIKQTTLKDTANKVYYNSVKLLKNLNS